jgi:dipeptidyl aminopeptidase/acylaminoacyl peptidase
LLNASESAPAICHRERVSVFDQPIHPAIEAWVAELQRAFRQTAGHAISDLAQAAPHPRRDLVAVTAALRPEPDSAERRVVLLVDGSGTPRPVLSGAGCWSPVWSPDGDRLCVLADDGAVITDTDGVESARTPDVGGLVEVARWSPDGRRLLLVVAEPGAEISDVWGSGTVGGVGTESWRPHVLPAATGRRRLVEWEVGSTDHRVLTRLNVWEADWVGHDAVALVSDGAGEGAWYDAWLVQISPDATVALLHEERFQIARPAGSPDGRAWSAITGFASDRDLLAGELLVGRLDGEASRVATPGVHVTEHRWLDDRTILFIGQRSLATVLGTVDVTTGECTELWSGTATTGRYQPELGGLAADGRPVLVLERHDLPPTLARIEADGTAAELLSSRGPGTDAVRAAYGEARPVSWTAPDGLAMDGLLDVPRTPGPHPLVVHPHGGPVCGYRDGWIGRDAHTVVLVARGYAVFRPNPRGSSGRGPEFAEAVRGDMGGLDAQDILSGIDHLVASGLVDPERVGVVGQSYGGYLACWLPVLSSRFRAAVSRSPCTDWRSFHLTSNLAEFDRLFLDGDPWDPDSQYQTRNPLTHHHRIRTPTFLTAGSRDLATPANQAEQMYRALTERGVPAALAIYPEEGHGVQAPPALADQCARMVAWFERYMPAVP